MKTRLVLVGLTLGLFGFYTHVSAQVTATLPLNYVSKTTSAVDTVTVGSVMPYQVSGDVNFHALRKQSLFDFSDFTWSLSGGTAGTDYDLRNLSGNASSSPAAKDTTVSVKWLKTGPFKVNVQEKPVPATGMPAISCNADVEEMDVLVVARPTLAFPASAMTGGCGVAGTTVNIPVNVTGTGQYDVTYSIDYTPLTGSGSNKVTSKLVTIGSYQPGAQSLNLTYDVTAGEYGVYTVTIEKLSDRISRKSGVATLATDIPSTTFKIYSYPAPNTNPVTHIRNL